MLFRPTPGPTCVEGPTGSGKSYVVIEMILPLMRLGIPTFSNFPIRDHKSGYKSKKFDPSKRTLLMDCIVVLDEAWGLGLAAQDYRKIDPDDEEFFRYSRQNGVILIVISQSGSVKVVRDCCDTFIRCSCIHLPAQHKKRSDGSLELETGYPLIFMRTFRKKYDSAQTFLEEKSLFNPYVGSCYDHRTFRNKTRINYDDFEDWDTSMLKPHVALVKLAVIRFLDFNDFLSKNPKLYFSYVSFLIGILFYCFYIDFYYAAWGWIFFTFMFSMYLFYASFKFLVSKKRAKLKKAVSRG